jgi:hypothetical protein
VYNESHIHIGEINMRVFDNNEIFVLAITAISIVGIVCIGLLIVLTICILKQRRERIHEKNVPLANNSQSLSTYNGAETSLKISNWISFLSSERSVAFITVLNFGAILIAFVGIIFSTKTVGFWQTLLYGIIAIAFAIYAFYKIFRPFGRRGKGAEDILNQIMSGELTTEKDIREKWAIIMKKGKKLPTPTKKNLDLPNA